MKHIYFLLLILILGSCKHNSQNEVEILNDFLNQNSDNYNLTIKIINNKIETLDVSDFYFADKKKFDSLLILISSFNDLIELRIANSNIDTFYFLSGMNNLRSLEILNSNLSRVPALDSFFILEQLVLAECKINGNVNIESLPNSLVTFSLWGNKIDELRILQPTSESKLATLNLSNTNIRRINESIYSLPNLLMLHISNKYLETSSIEPDSFAGIEYILIDEESEEILSALRKKNQEVKIDNSKHKWAEYR
jgi:hypothetical protein